jgi:hypothetical protein
MSAIFSLYHTARACRLSRRIGMRWLCGRRTYYAFLDIKGARLISSSKLSHVLMVRGYIS